MRSSWKLFLAFAVAGCGPVESTIAAGSFNSTSSEGGLVGAILTVDRQNMTGTLTPLGKQPITLSFTLAPHDRWKTGCPTQFSSVLLETWEISPSPVVVGALSINEPLLTAGCAENSANADELALSSSDDTAHQVFVRGMAH